MFSDFVYADVILLLKVKAHDVFSIEPHAVMLFLMLFGFFQCCELKIVTEMKDSLSNSPQQQ